MPSQPDLLPRPRFSLWAAFGLTAAALLLWRGLPRPGEPPRGHRSLLKDVRLVLPAHGPGAPAPEGLSDLLWEDGRIVKSGPAGSLDPAGAKVYEGRGRAAAPSLVDAAVFLSMEGRPTELSVPAWAETSLHLQAAAGIAAVLDLSAKRDFIKSARNLDGRLPRAYFAGALFTSPGGWRLSGQTPWDSNVVELIEPDDISLPWSLALRFGDEAAFASVENEGRDTMAIPPATLKRLARLAHAQGLPFIVHAEHSAKALEALAAGPDAILGPLMDAGDGRLAAELRARGVVYIPALSVVLNCFPPKPLPAWLASFPASAAVDSGTLKAAAEPERVAAWRRAWQRRGADPDTVLAVPGVLARAGVRLAFGTSSGRPLVFHGLGAQTEVYHLSRAGFSAAEILAMSEQSRGLLGLKADGLRPGTRADLNILGADPGLQPGALAAPDQGFLGGLPVWP